MSALAHRGDHIHPGDVSPLGQHVGPLIHRIVEDGKPQVGHAQIVDVREHEGQTIGHRVPRFNNAVEFAARVAGRLLDERENPIEGSRDLLRGVQCLFSYDPQVIIGRMVLQGGACTR